MNRSFRRPHLLYIAFAFPPSTASSVYRSLAVPNEFAAAGWDVTVLTIHAEIWSEVSGTDESLLQSVHERIRVVRISDGGSEERARADLRRYSRLRVEAPFVWQKLMSFKSRRKFPEAYHGLWLSEAKKAARYIHSERPVDLAMATASPYVSFEVARSLKGVPYVLDYRDAWAFHTFSGKPNFSPRSRAGRTEASLLRTAAQIWFVNEPIRAEYARLYPFAEQKMRVIPNGFDPQPGHRKPLVGPVTKPTFGYLGTIPHVNTPLNPLFAGWRKAFGLAPDRSEIGARALIRGKLSSSGRTSAEVLSSFERMKEHGLEYGGPVPKRDVAAFYQSLDALILLLPGGKYVTGGKTSEYLATGLPIVSVHDLSNATSDLLQEYPLWFPARSLTQEGISEALIAASSFLECPDQEKFDAAWEYGQQFLRSRMLEPVITELAGLVASIPYQVEEPHTSRVGGGGCLDKECAQQPKTEQMKPPNTVTVGLIGSDESSTLAFLDHAFERLRGVGTQDPVFWSAYPGSAGEPSVSLTELRRSFSGPVSFLLRTLERIGGPAGTVCRLLERTLLSRRFSETVNSNPKIASLIEGSAVIVAIDDIAIRAVWGLRRRTDAKLVYGPAALLHAYRVASAG